MDPLVIIDFSNFVYTCWYPALAAQKADPKYDPTIVLETNMDGKLRTIRRAMEEANFNNPEYVMVEDRPSKRKLEIYPLYKANRERGDIDPRPMAKRVLHNWGYNRWCWSKDNEADDAIATLACQQPEGRQVIICTSDKDLWQLLSDDIFVYQITKDKFVTAKTVEEKFKVVHPVMIPMTKALWGDTSDDIPNVMPRMQKQLLPIINAGWCDLGTFLSQAIASPALTERCRDMLIANLLLIRRNWKLVKLDRSCDLTWE